MRTRNGAFVLSSMRSYVRKCNDLLVVNESAQTVVILPHRCIASNNAPSDAGRQRESVRDIALRSNLLVYTHPEIASQFPCIYHSAPNAGTPYVHASSARLHNNLLLRARKTSLYTRLEQALQKYLRPRTQKTRVQQKNACTQAQTYIAHKKRLPPRARKRRLPRLELREQKVRLDKEFGEMLGKIADRKDRLLHMERKLAALDRTRLGKEVRTIRCISPGGGG